MNLVVLGAPGAGKGTQARNLAANYGLTHISTGDILRDNIRRHTELGNTVGELINSGGLVPDSVAIDLIRNAMKEKGGDGFVIDGFPRTLYQAEVLEDLVEITQVISVKINDDVIIERMTGRLTCPGCSSMYHSHYHPPKHPGICDNCRTALAQRDDDKLKTVKNRLDIYHRLSEPIIRYYREKGLLLEVDGVGDINGITDSIMKSLNRPCDTHTACSCALGEANGYTH